MFGGEPRPDEPTVDLKVLHAKIGQLALENDFLEGALIKAGDVGDVLERNRTSRLGCKEEATEGIGLDHAAISCRWPGAAWATMSLFLLA